MMNDLILRTLNAFLCKPCTQKHAPTYLMMISFIRTNLAITCSLSSTNLLALAHVLTGNNSDSGQETK